ncbi:hypothetical protein [Aeromonas veronii]|uniref:hypothetical protein n=1 Tax=Aeromonas veronii TaxID=654 RepID=UPI003BA01C6B
MKITLSPANCMVRLVASVDGDKLTVNDVELDFSELVEGSTLPVYAISNEWIAGDVHRINGEIHLTLLLPHGPDATQETRFPTAMLEPISIASGLVPLPPYGSEEELA